MDTITRTAARPYQVLDPRTMGRPVHLLGRYTDRFRKDLSGLFQQWFNRRYRSQFEIGEVTVETTKAPATPRWLSFGAHAGRMSFAADRSVLLCILAYRYGVQPTALPAGSDASDDANEPETATEERLASRLGHQLTSAAAAAIEALQPDAAAGANAPRHEFSPSAAALPDDAWTLRVRVSERVHRIDGTLWFRLDEHWIARLLRGLAPDRERGKSRTAAGTPAQPLPARLQLTLDARVLEKQMPLGTLLDLRIGDVIPITLGTSDVLIGDSRLFTASVAENKGKLCLTCFEDVE
ncbi:MAG TPA: FliM/FliN family flagellar motor C-terminal domain-containing protein [Povalibacter sp.]|uniref:FliM/FliN family flagellar motor C-terminal domain-containing protein n=1 Tax=Povalibacter sp. TaxID=1962978 RepID=UPI002C77F2C5|nr:FliM/FliN family flagellar motor C-terminal domain-containing protein [Povalibacter sp.]HMN43158.1 FliM/FliN family flagellar motor C-terminal domain-containing protein [Povalibacter sp.]